MPIGYRIDQSLGVTIGVWHGDIGAEEIAAATERLFAEPDWPPSGGRHLTDLTTVRTMPDLEELAKAHKALGRARGIRLAVVASEHFDEARRYEHAVATAGLAVVVFTQVPSACAWLGIDYTATQTAINELRRQLRETASGTP